MDTVTYPHQDVQRELAHWILGKVDISEYPEVAKSLQVVGIPVAIALEFDGKEVGRILGFKKPKEFEVGLKTIRIVSTK